MPDWISFTLGVLLSSSGWGALLLAHRRKPKIRGRWITHELDGYPDYEGATVEVVVGKRSIEIEEIGLRATYKKGKGKSHYYLRGHVSLELPAHLSDGQTVRAGWDLDTLIHRLDSEIGNHRFEAKVCPYVIASGKEYKGRIMKDGARIAFRQRLGSPAASVHSTRN